MDFFTWTFWWPGRHIFVLNLLLLFGSMQDLSSYEVVGTKWDKYDLTYSIETFAPRIPWRETSKAIRKAFQVWKDVSPFTFEEIPNEDIHNGLRNVADITINFFAGPHKGHTFISSELAHESSPRPGRKSYVHFNSDRQWSITNQHVNGSYNVFLVAVHSLGHSLGLGHSDDTSSIMHGLYKWMDTDNFQLPADDRQGIQAIYGYGPKNVLLAVDPPGDVVKGSSITLTCSGIGSHHAPIHSYILFKDNTAVAQKNTMTISNVQPSHSGTYHCEAWSDIAGVNSPPLTVDVHYPPEIPSVSVSPPGGVVERSTVTLSCSSDANPPVDTYTWYKDRSSISTGPQLVKENVSLTDSGQYICLVKNTHGVQRSSPHSLDVRSPMLPTHCGPPEVYRSNSIMISRMKSRYAPRVTVLYECMVGYTMTGGRSDVRCVAGKWTPLTLTCEGQCGRRTDPTGNEPWISGGTPSRPGDHPWQVSLQHRAKGTSNAFGHACGGVLIDSCWVLTAAHCINIAKDMQVVVGGVDIGSKERSDQVISVERDFVHPDYRKIFNTTYSDIALLKLKVTEDPFCAKETSYVKYACLPNKLFPDGKDCVVAGWGSTKNADHPHHMSHGQLSLMSKERCKVFHGSLLDDTMICAGDKLGRVGSCSGDSGGPLMCKEDGVYYTAGLVSWESATCGASIPGVYANVHRYVEWISGCIAHNGSPCRTQSAVYDDEYDYTISP